MKAQRRLSWARRTLLVAVPSALAVLVLLPTRAPLPVSGSPSISITVGIDADSTGNSASSLAAIDACRSVASGATFSIDFYVTDIPLPGIDGFQGAVNYDRTLINVTGYSINWLLAVKPNSSVVDLTKSDIGQEDHLPDADGKFTPSAYDWSAQPGHSETGSGVLARLTLRAMAAGTSPLTLTRVKLTDPSGQPIGDLDENGTFDGPIFDAEIRIGEPCPTPTPTPTITSTATATATATRTASPTATATATATHTATPTATATATATRTATPTATASATATAEATSGPSVTPSPSPSPTAAPCSPGSPNFDGDGSPLGSGAGIGNGRDVSGHDATVPNSDLIADDCDDDDDNDGLPDSADPDPRGDNTYDDNNDGTLLNSGFVPVTSLAGDVDTNTTSIPVVTSSAVAPGDTVKIQSERLFVTAVPSATSLTVIRGYLGSAAAPHPIGTGVFRNDDGPSWDSNGNAVRDGVESICAGAAVDIDGNGDTDNDDDGLLDKWEVCKWGTDLSLQDTDADGIKDCKEAADVNGDGVADFVGDTIFYAKAALLPAAAFGKDGDFDLNGDGVIDFVGDVIQEAKFALISGMCR